MERRKTGIYVSCNYTKETVNLLFEWSIKNNIRYPLDKRHYHTTLLYSRSHVEGAQEICDLISFNERIILYPIGFKLFDSSDSSDLAALVLEFEAPQLVNIHNQLIANGGTHDYPDYTPHLTLSYKAFKNTDLSKFVIPDFNIIVKKFKAEPLDLDWNE